MRIIDKCLPKDKIGNFITEQEKSDVVHDFLAFLAEQMIEMNKEKQREIKSFLEWLEREIGAKIDEFSGKTTIKEYYKEENNIDKLIEVLKKNKSKLGLDPGRREYQDRLKEEYDKSIAKLNPLLQKIKDTDDLIDQIVYKLYGLTEEEIGIVGQGVKR
jgi:type II restriction/modification system DNA methylase subunit YeeA